MYQRKPILPVISNDPTITNCPDNNCNICIQSNSLSKSPYENYRRNIKKTYLSDMKIIEQQLFNRQMEKI